MTTREQRKQRSDAFKKVLETKASERISRLWRDGAVEDFLNFLVETESMVLHSYLDEFDGKTDSTTFDELAKEFNESYDSKMNEEFRKSILEETIEGLTADAIADMILQQELDALDYEIATGANRASERDSIGVQEDDPRYIPEYYDSFDGTKF